MATLAKGKTFGATEEVTNTKLHQLIDNGTVSNIVNADIDNSAAIANGKLALLSGGSQGDILYRNASDWVKLSAGTSGQFLKTQGAGANPAWATVTANAAIDSIVRGFELVYNNTTTVIVNPGTLYHGATQINTTTATTLTLATAADWWDGATDDYSGGAGWCYIGVDSSGNIKLCGANPPDKADTSGNTAGTLLYWYDTSLYWRIIGAIRVNTSNNVDYKFFQQGDRVYYDDYRTDTTILLNAGSAGSFTDVDCSSVIPAISQLAVLEGDASSDYYSWRRNGVSTTEGQRFWAANGGSIAVGAMLDSSQVGEYKKATNNVNIYGAGYVLNIR